MERLATCELTKCESSLLWGKPGVSWHVLSGNMPSIVAGPIRYLQWSEESKLSIEQFNSARRGGNSLWCHQPVSTMGTVPLSERPRKVSTPVVDPKAAPPVEGPTSQYFTLSQAAARLGTGGTKPSTKTLWRWARHGCRGVKLEYSRFGREIRVTETALAEFARELAASDRPLDSPRPTVHTPSPKPRNAARRAKEIAASETFLRQRGLM